MVRICPAQGSEVIHIALMQNIVQMCQRFLCACYIFLRASGAIQGHPGPLISTLSQTSPGFLRVCNTSLLKTL